MPFIKKFKSADKYSYFEHEGKILRKLNIKKLSENKQSPLNDILKTSLLKAFDEGSESPFDLREATVNKILKSTNKKINEAKDSDKVTSVSIPAPDLLLLRNAILIHLPKFVTELTSTLKKSWITGGCIPRFLTFRRNLTGSMWSESDIDIYVPSDIDIPKILKLGTAACEFSEVTNKEYTQYNKNIGNKIQKIYMSRMASSTLNLITGDFSTIDDVWDSFDFRFLQTGLEFQVSENKETTCNYIINSTRSWEDLVLRRICLTPSYVKAIHSKKVTVNISKKRIKKYIQRGFSDHTGIIEHNLFSYAKR